MKILLFTDLHLSTYTQFSTVNENGMNTRLLEQLMVINKVAEVARKEKVEAIYFLGDLLHGLTESIPKIIYNAAYLVVNNLAEACPVHMLVGNHDQFRKLTILANFDDIKNVYLYENTTQLDNGIDMVPWDCPIPKVKNDILLGHIGLNGAYVNADFTRTHVDGTPPESLFGYKYIYLGHFHTRQLVKIYGATEAMYIGSVMANQFGEDILDRGVTIFEDGKSRFIQIQSPKFKEATVSTQEELETLLEFFEKNTDYYRLKVTSPEVKVPALNHRVQVSYEFAPTREARLEEKENEDLWDTVERFIEGTTTAIDKQKAIKVLREVRQ